MKTAIDLKIPFTWEERRPVLLERFFYIPGAYDHQEMVIRYFENDLPVIVEYCSGNGQWIGERARQNPQFNWIAVEKKFERARKIWLKLHREQIPNLCVVCGEGFIFTKYYGVPFVEAFINFPDPWPKRRHAKHRLIQPKFLREVARLMIGGGKMTCVTDDPKFASKIIEEFEDCPEWNLLFNVNEWPDYGPSFFQDLWKGKGREIHYLSYEKIS